MRVRSLIGGAFACVIAALIAGPTLAADDEQAAPPPPCADPQITDANGDGHHIPTDVLSAWLTEEGGSLQAVIRVKLGKWVPEHDDPEIVAGYAFLFSNDGLVRYVRLSVNADDEETWDYGNYTAAADNPFTSLGTTTGTRELNPTTPGAATIDVPAALADPGDLLTGTFVLTYDGIVGGVPVWVDQAPGGELPTDPARGADYRVGECSAVNLTAPMPPKGGGKVTISGSVLPAAAGVEVEITRQAKTTVTTSVFTDASGNYSLPVKVGETTKVRAEANGISSQTKTMTVRSTVQITKTRLANGKTRIRAVTKPWLPGILKLYRGFAITPTSTKRTTGAPFTFPARDLRPGRYQVIYTPDQGRAVRSLSNFLQVQ